MAVAALAAVAALGAAGVAAVASAPPPPDRRPNVIVVLTDDQPWGTFDEMPWLHGELGRPASGWREFPLAFANTPLCCPARASLLTGRYARHTGVFRNDDGALLDETSTIATWLHDAGYRTGLVGKYLNRFPFGGPPYVPRGWDRFVAKQNQTGATVYRDFHVIDQGVQVPIRDAYATDWLAERAIDFVRTAPASRPFFLLFAPSAPHEPWIPATRHAGLESDEAIVEPPNVVGALRGAPPWVRALPVPGAAQRARWVEEQRRMGETLRAVDDAVRGIVTALGDRLDRTFVFVLTDNGYAFGEHRWEGKKCPYEACVRIPFAVHAVGVPPATTDAPVSIVDLAPTIASIAGVPPPPGIDGVAFATWIDGRWALRAPPPEAVFLEWVGARDIPAWTAVRTQDLKLIRYADGTEELYDLGGRRAPPDPWEMDNRVDDPRYRDDLTDLRELLGAVMAPG
jgi:arylsulfatase A-like enzyme